MITNINRETFNASIITELYRMRWQIEVLFKVLKSTLSIDKMHVGKTKYVEAILYGKLLGALLQCHFMIVSIKQRGKALVSKDSTH